MNSSADRLPCSWRRARCMMRTAAGKEGAASRAMQLCGGAGTVARHTSVMTPRLPSLPRNRCGRCSPTLSLARCARRSSVRPAPSTTRRPRRYPCKEPYRTTRMPPAFVAMLPPMWQEPRAPRSSGTRKPCWAAAASSSARVTPASAVMTPELVSKSEMRRMRDMFTTMSWSRGTPPPTKPVLPPCGTTPMPCLPAYLMTSATSSTQPGCTTARAEPVYFLLQSTSCVLWSSAGTTVVMRPSAATWSETPAKRRICTLVVAKTPIAAALQGREKAMVWTWRLSGCVASEPETQARCSWALM